MHQFPGLFIKNRQRQTDIQTDRETDRHTERLRLLKMIAGVLA